MANEDLSNADLELLYLTTIEGATGPSLADAREQIYGSSEHAYFAALSGLTPATFYSLSDHALTYYRSEVDPDSLSLADTARLFWLQELAGGGPPPGEMTITLTDSDFSDAALTTYSFPAQNLGPASADRIILVCVGSRANVANTVVTVATNPATELVGTAFNTQGQVKIWAVALAAGTTGDIDISFGGSASRVLFSVYAVTGASITPTSVANANGANITSVAGGIVVACSVAFFSSGESECTWSPVEIVEDVDLIADAIINYSSGFDSDADAETVPVTATWSNFTDTVYACAVALEPA